MSIPQMVKDRAMVTIDARLEPHFSVTYFFLLQTSRSRRKLSEYSAKSINFTEKSRTLEFGKKGLLSYSGHFVISKEKDSVNLSLLK